MQGTERSMPNYQKEMETILADPEVKGKRLLLHSCCAPCSSHVLTLLRGTLRITVFYYNPNITDDTEYKKRVTEQIRLIGELNRLSDGAYPIEYVIGDYAPDDFFAIAEGYEQCPEGGERCFRCYELRLKESVRMAAEGSYDFVTTTLSISPLKNAEKLNEIGMRLAHDAGVRYLPSDFKKKDGYKHSIELSREYGLYRQDYCGCIYSKR
ncbi:MAG: epoxyqueuosine reductase QueH [Lachnospiraceae bacterium]|nr:epoxyqueuosine reductase QueH [Lachnospiraceae bacterium]